MSSQKKILVFGATGPTGQLFCEKTLANGHTLTIYARTPSKLPDHIRNHENVTIIEAQLTDNQALTSSVKDQDIIVSLLGPNSLSTPPTLFSSAYSTILVAMKTHNVKRILALGTISIAAPNDQTAFAASLSVIAVRTVANSGYAAIRAVAETFEKEGEGIFWTIFRVGGLADGEEGEVVETSVGGAGYTGSVRRADVARWLVGQCEKYQEGVEGGRWDKEMPLLCSVGTGLFSWRPRFGRILGLSG